MNTNRRSNNSVAEAMSSTLRNLSVGSKIRESLAFAYWMDVVGEQAGAASEPESIRDGILFVRTKSSVWSQELLFLKDHIISELNRRIGYAAIKDVRFRAKGLSRKEPLPQEEQPAFPTPEELELVQLTAEDKATLDKNLKVVSVTDPQMRTAIERRLIRDRKIRRWRLEHGWRKCTRCSAIHRVEGEICPVCRLSG